MTAQAARGQSSFFNPPRGRAMLATCMYAAAARGAARTIRTAARISAGSTIVLLFVEIDPRTKPSYASWFYFREASNTKQVDKSKLIIICAY